MGGKIFQNLVIPPTITFTRVLLLEASTFLSYVITNYSSITTPLESVFKDILYVYLIILDCLRLENLKHQKFKENI